MDIAVGLSGISKSFGSLTVLDDVNLTVAEGSFTSLLGPSGCGKTTLLNIIGGLDRPTAGEIRFGSDPIYSDRQGIDVPTERRNIGYVFQSYALWPHMTVLQNVGYALKIRRAPAAERQQRSREMLEKLELGPLADRYPFQLSGG
ncbi:MAG TPA: ABC transporter ATP-binding protein, partial [Inquilinus sp.]